MTVVPLLFLLNQNYYNFQVRMVYIFIRVVQIGEFSVCVCAYIYIYFFFFCKYIYTHFFGKFGWSCDHPKLQVALPITVGVLIKCSFSVYL